MQLKFISLLIAITLIVFSCSKNQVEDIPATDPGDYYSFEESAILQQSLNLPSPPYVYSYSLPNHLANNQAIEIDKDIATLGRVLFYDPTLSENQSTSCGSCHQAVSAFGDNAAFSTGVFNRRTKRNTYALGSFTIYPSAKESDQTAYYWDGNTATIEEVIERSITNPSQLGIEIEDYLNRIVQKPYYEVLFRKAFPEEVNVSKEKIVAALVAFVSSIYSTTSTFDQALIDIDASSNYDFSQSLPELSIAENAGKNLFALHCASCHQSTLFNLDIIEYANNGLELSYEDDGVYEHTGQVSDRGLFKIPSLRNVEYSAPYMHDGRFQSLEQVIDFYSTDIANHFNLDDRLKTSSGQAKEINFTASEKEDLIAFLKTLSDPNQLNALRYSSPFN